MTDRVVLGQYIPGNSPVHRLDPRIKILLIVVFMVTVFLIDRFLGYGLLFLGILAVIQISGVPFKRVLMGLKPILAIVLFTFVINVLTTPGRVLWSYWIFRVTEEGLLKAAFISLRIALLVFGTTLLTLTTSPLALTDGIESLMKPLTLLKFPTGAFAMMISIALRFIPTLFEETDKIMRAQKARGADFESGNVIRRAKAMIPLMVPLFLGAIQRAQELGVAMEARCYRSGEGRTRLNPLRFSPSDWMVFVPVVLFFIAMAVFL